MPRLQQVPKVSLLSAAEAMPDTSTPFGLFAAFPSKSAVFHIFVLQFPHSLHVKYGQGAARNVPPSCKERSSKHLDVCCGCTLVVSTEAVRTGRQSLCAHTVCTMTDAPLSSPGTSTACMAAVSSIGVCGGGAMVAVGQVEKGVAGG